MGKKLVHSTGFKYLLRKSSLNVRKSERAIDDDTIKMKFSERFGYSTLPTTNIREDAPEGLRAGFIEVFGNRLGATALREIVCKALRKRPDSNNWSPSNVFEEASCLIYSAQWYKFYEIVEAVLTLPENYGEEINAMNTIFEEEGMAWIIKGKEIVLRISDIDAELGKLSVYALRETNRPVAAREMDLALRALSARPESETRDAVSRALRSMECAAKDVTGDRDLTLGQILKKHGDLLPSPLNEAFSKIWGYASNVARHVDETKAPTFEEAYLIVGLCNAVVGFLARKG